MITAMFSIEKYPSDLLAFESAITSGVSRRDFINSLRDKGADDEWEIDADYVYDKYPHNPAKRAILFSLLREAHTA